MSINENSLPDEWRAASSPIGFEEFSALFKTFTHSAFRLESLPAYSVSHEDQHYAAYLSGANQPPFKFDDWKNTIATATSSGKSFYVIRIVPEPLTKYFEYEMDWCY